MELTRDLAAHVAARRRRWVPCDDLTAFKEAATFPGKGQYGVTCGVGSDKLASCAKFCAKVCDKDTSIRCSGMPTEAEGFILASSKSLTPLPPLRHIDYRKDTCSKGVCVTMNTKCTTDADCFVRGTQEVVDGLKRLDAYLDQKYPKHSILVTSCWRDGWFESKQECYYVMDGKNPVKMGMAWPGANPHSSGKGCGLYLRGPQSLSRDTACPMDPGVRAASKLLDEMLTGPTVGALRLDYEPVALRVGRQHAVQSAGLRERLPAERRKMPSRL